jgi:hypothetical protein
MHLLFEEAGKSCFNPPEERLKKLQKWVENTKTANRGVGNLEARSNQYNKAEQLLTFYVFAPLVLSPNKVGLVNRALSLAGVSPYEENVADVGLERLYAQPKGYLKWLKGNMDAHPVRYISEDAKKHRPNQPLESRTHVDAFIETDKLLIFFEVKFTADISHSTAYNPTRNQLSRLIDVGLDLNEHNGKEVLIILTSPRAIYEKRSRLYYYKIQEYINPELIREDIVWRPLPQIRDNVLAVRWIAIEDLIDVFYQDFVHKEKDEALKFFKERNLCTT